MGVFVSELPPGVGVVTSHMVREVPEPVAEKGS